MQLKFPVKVAATKWTNLWLPRFEVNLKNSWSSVSVTMDEEAMLVVYVLLLRRRRLRRQL